MIVVVTVLKNPMLVMMVLDFLLSLAMPLPSCLLRLLVSLPTVLGMLCWYRCCF